MPLTSDGRCYRVRPISAVDREHLQIGLGKMSPTTLYQRFHHYRRAFTDAELDFLTACDGKTHIAYVCRAIDDDGEEGEGVGVARVYRDTRDPKVGEVAIVVIDSWQNTGVGTALIQALADHCRQVGILDWRAVIVGDNDRVLHLLSRVGEVVERVWQDRSQVLRIHL
ncbi:MAG: GNAT family N-acetyltransferase [Armatimonadetes bacterium]|nr:GNAT family N-acetyltransferase [Armatimonadota bacterium]